jgi:glycine/D-amino acid oxidase-like deaminating enzyme
MPAEILIVGQGLAGSVLAWEFERAGFSFEVADPGESGTASQLAAGMINPITGMRFVKSPDFERHFAAAHRGYREIEEKTGVSLWREMRIHRLFRTAQERQTFEAKFARGDFQGFVEHAQADGFWIERAARVDTALLLSALRARLASAGRLRAERVNPLAEVGRYSLVIDCTGAAIAGAPGFRDWPWRRSKGEILRVAAEGLDPSVIVNQRYWLLPLTPQAACVGATHEPIFADGGPSAGARKLLTEAAMSLLGAVPEVLAHEAALRLGLRDYLPVVGRHPTLGGLGVFAGLGNKGVLTAPGLARQWMNHLSEGVPFGAEVAVDRFPPIRSTWV